MQGVSAAGERQPGSTAPTSMPVSTHRDFHRGRIRVPVIGATVKNVTSQTQRGATQVVPCMPFCGRYPLIGEVFRRSDRSRMSNPAHSSGVSPASTVATKFQLPAPSAEAKIRRTSSGRFALTCHPTIAALVTDSWIAATLSDGRVRCRIAEFAARCEFFKPCTQVSSGSTGACGEQVLASFTADRNVAG